MASSGRKLRRRALRATPMHRVKDARHRPKACKKRRKTGNAAERKASAFSNSKGEAATAPSEDVRGAAGGKGLEERAFAEYLGYGIVRREET